MMPKKTKPPVKPTFEPLPLLSLLLDQLQQVVGYTRAAVLKVERQELVLLVYRGLPLEEMMTQRTNLANTWLRREVIRRREPIIIDNIHDDSVLVDTFKEIADQLPPFSVKDICSWLGVPIIIREEVVGLLALLHEQPDYYKTDQVQLVLSFAHHLGLALENDDLYQQVHYLATLTERERLARAFHDRLAQTLGLINLKAALAHEFLRANQHDQVEQSLTELKQFTQATYADVREAIFDLRTRVDSGPNFLPMLREYLAGYNQQYGPEVHLIIADDALAEFSAEVSTQVIRIIQEALSNIRKHARANRVTLRFLQEAGQICIGIEDDGQGFDIEQLTVCKQPRGFGLQIMRERAAAVGGRVEIDTWPGQGTRLMVWLPKPVGG